MKHTQASKVVGSPNGHATRGRKIKAHWRPFLVASLITATVIPLRMNALTINAIFDSTITSDPNHAAIESTINSAIAVYEADFSDPITATIRFQESTSGLGSSSTYYVVVNYSDYINALKSHATSEDDATFLAHLPTGSDNPVNGNSQMSLKTPLARALGFSANPPAGDPDSTISLNMSIINITSSNPNQNYYSLLAVASHEIDEGLAFGGGLNGVTNGQAAPTDSSVEPQDLGRYNTSGGRSWTSDVNESAWESFDGVTLLVRFNQHQGGDFADWYSYYGGQTPRVQDAYGTPGSFPVLGVELRVLDAIGFTYNQAHPTWVDFNYSGSQNGSYAEPWETLSAGVSHVPTGGTIAINAGVQPSQSSETLTITKAMTIISAAGPSTIGN
jgi:hypothetical protein